MATGEAQTFCRDCQEYYCSVCINLHNDFTAFKNHQILDKARLQPGSSVQFPMVPTEKCKVHGHKPVDMYCRQHDDVGCSICMVMQHNTCKDKEYVPDYIKRVNVESSSIVMEQLGTIASSLGMLQETFLKEKTNLTSRKDESLQEIRKFRLEIDKQLDELEKNTVEDLDGVFQSVKDKIDATLKELQYTITEVQSAQDNLTSAGKNVAQMFVSVRIANNVATNANKTVTKAQHNIYSTEISFVSHQKMQSLFNQAEALGSISVTETLQSRLRYPGPLSGETTQINTVSRKPV